MNGKRTGEPSRDKALVTVLGAGHFGTALGHHLARLDHKTTLWSRDQNVVEGIRHERRNPRYLSDLRLADKVTATTDLEASLGHATMLVVAIPTQALRSVLTRLLGAKLNPSCVVVSTAKGIELASGLFPPGVFEEVLGTELGARLVSLSGPSFAEEIAKGVPTGLVAAGLEASSVELVCKTFRSKNLRVEASADPTGLAVAGATKNIYAIAAGAAEAVGLGANAQALLLTKCLAEMTSIAMAMGAKGATLQGLAGLGDLLLTCSSTKSRNFRVGQLLAKGETLVSSMQKAGSVSEGVSSAKAIRPLLSEHSIEARFGM